ncbi:transposase [Halomonas piscis]|uniref:Transposase n=1 Tax=Halomonas piscis TaxID=3031727 RepID=A0ABY9Z281_9GAMM|nr:transposase [Halomonas piscis]WNK21242.1 transposase [Halomonas piscis]
MSTPGYVSLRKGRLSLPGYCYHITMCTRNRQPVFLDYLHARSACRTFGEKAIGRYGATQAFVVMPDHVHWLLQLEGDLSGAVRVYKSKVSIAVGQPVWEDGFHDRALRHEDNIRQVARYVVANPLRAGLVDEIGQYPYWDAIWL